ncbi:MAG: ABC transporter ATP-binding protein [Victivallales bacterium]|nr:ABC transporter ATP-binding protein [Victivallales bacterium]
MQSSKSRYKEYRKQRGFFGQKHPDGPPAGGGPVRGMGVGRMMRGMGGGGFGGGMGRGFGGPHGGFGGPPMPGDGSRKQPLSYYLKRYLGTLGEHKKYIFTLIFFGVFSLVLRAVNPWTSKFMLDYVFADKPKTLDLGPFLNEHVLHRGPQTLLLWTCVALAAIALSELVIGAVSEYVSRVLSSKMQVSIRRKMMKHMQAMPLAKLEQLKTGGIISRIEGDVNSFAALLHEGFLTPLTSLLMFIVGLGSLLLISPIVTLICTCFVIALAFVAYAIFNVMRPLFRDLHEDHARISGKLAETFGGIRVVRIFGREPYETADFIGSHHLLIRKSLHTDKLNIAIHRLVQLINIGMDITIWAVGGYYVIKGKITIGDLMVFTRFTHWFFQPVFMIMHSLSHVQNSVACTERIFDMLDEDVAIVDKPDAIPVHRIEKGIHFDHIDFEYDAGKPVLKDFSLDIPAGKTLALVGPSGVGKTTITNLLVRFYEQQKGSILLDGKDIRDFQLRSYRALFSLVLQDVFLFDGTIAENISYSVPDATPEQIQAAAKIAAAADFIEEFPDKYDTLIGERGVRLSGGQKQRISLARAILRDPQVLILDEATSSLDSQSEAAIQTALKDILKGRTTVVIAHRLSTIMDADSIAVIDDGHVVEQGTHHELLEKNGKYAEMYNKQMEKAVADPTHLIWGAPEPQ